MKRSTVLTASNREYAIATEPFRKGQVVLLLKNKQGAYFAFPWTPNIKHVRGGIAAHDCDADKRLEVIFSYPEPRKALEMQ